MERKNFSWQLLHSLIGSLIVMNGNAVPKHPITPPDLRGIRWCVSEVYRFRISCLHISSDPGMQPDMPQKKYELCHFKYTGVNITDFKSHTIFNFH